ncbi:unnamed protein product [Discosporangium mesarthrocarpum]
MHHESHCMSGEITQLSLSVEEGTTAGHIPVTAPSTMELPTTGLVVSATETYGLDKTYYLATSEVDVPSLLGEPLFGSQVLNDGPIIIDELAVGEGEGDGAGGDAEVDSLDG